jgi:hypothetical protein
MEYEMIQSYQGQTGPKSLPGKKNSSMNALKTGLFAKSTILPFEDVTQYKKHNKQILMSLLPENAIEQALVQQIADSLWRGARLELRSTMRREEVIKQLTPQDLAGLLGIAGKRQARAPDYLVTPNHQILKKDIVLPKKCLQHYDHLVKNVKGVANYESVWRHYQELFTALHYWLKADGKVDLFRSDFSALNLAWQQRPRLIEEQLEVFNDHCWYLVHFKELRSQIQNWMANWYFLRTQESHSITKADDFLLKERRYCLSLLDTYCKMRKSTQEQLLFSQKYLQVLGPPAITTTISKEDMSSEATDSKGQKIENEMQQSVAESVT